MLKKNIKLFNISEVAQMFGLINKKNNKPSTDTLRFWETKFKQLKPKILTGSRRYYTEKDIDTIKMIVFLLKEQGLTINGAKKILENNPKQLDDFKTSSIKASYYINKIKSKSKKILIKIKKLNG